MEDDVPMLVAQDVAAIELSDASGVPNPAALPKVPVTVITGFLGSGKTTLLNYVLHADHGYRIAVVQNEFGEEIGLERAVAMGKRPQLVDIDANGETKPNAIQEWLELPNGCICCTAKDNLVLALEKLVERRSKFDYIFIETTGMADPGPLAKTLWVDEELCSSIYLDAVITLVDAHLIRYHLQDEKRDFTNQGTAIEPRKIEAMRQIALADVVLINKVDLLPSEQDQKDIQTQVEAINGLAKVFFTQRSRIDLSQIMGINSFDGRKLPAEMSHLKADTPPHNHKDDHKSEHAHAHEKPHSDGVNTIVFKVDGDVKSTEVALHWFAQLLWEEKIGIYRIKGELAIQNSPYRHIVQGVFDNFEVQPTEFAWEDALPTPTIQSSGTSSETVISSVRRNTLVFIGINLDREQLYTSFCQTCLA